ncbi:SAM-dependent methyltransferase [Vibrio sp. qd031]|uniref:class I SAM-dependent methyltransferase n=1 Tax=Vibrio sp. qd031 TaxID=1603038 RepID=UPI000A11652C|nr:class I SAM-dependent methyltransferase [Vibrio sp. qd031]ORT48767.1 SAM-dependent methyltransferase [Vibrio sp. qd031]
MNTSQKFWDKAAKKYAKSPIADEQAYQKKLQQTQAKFTPDMNILEFGCGTGSTALIHAPFVEHILAIDISENMVQIARQKADKESITNVTFKRKTLEDLDATQHRFDMVLGLNILHLLPNRQDVIKHVVELLEPGGSFVSSSACLGGTPLALIKWVAPLGKALGLMPDVFVFTQQQLVAELEQAGLVVETQWHHGKNGLGVFIIATKPD